jgi:methionine aminopeptidase
VIQLKSPREIDIMARGGQILGATVAMLQREVKPGMTTWQLDELAEAFIPEPCWRDALVQGPLRLPWQRMRVDQ